MTEPEENPEELELTWAPVAVTVRAVYDDEGRLNSITTEYLEPPPAEEIARIVAQFMNQTVPLPNRRPGGALREARRDANLAREFKEVLGDTVCAASANILYAEGTGHDNHECCCADGHNGRHLCACGSRF